MPNFHQRTARNFFLPLDRVFIVLVVVFCMSGFSQAATPAFVEKPVPRVVVVFYDSSSEKTWFATTMHQHMELPANHLGLVFEPHDINAPWPDLTHRDDVRGILLWFHGDTISDPSGFIHWCLANLRDDRRLGMIGSSGLLADKAGHPTPQGLIDQLTALLGVGILPDFVNTTYKYSVGVMNPAYFGFEAPVATVLPEFERAYALPNARVLLSAKSEGGAEQDVLAASGPRGAYVVGDDYTYVSVDELDRVHWILNPFAFLRDTFDTDRLPAPDYTTLDGQRIYFSHIDGDGWRNRSQIPTKEGRQQRAVDVFYSAVLSAYPDLPFTVAPVAADLDPAWCGDDQSRSIARKIMALPNVEPASHTYSHALYWDFFKDAATAAAREAPVLSQYPPCIDNNDSLGRIGKLIDKLEGKKIDNDRAGGTEGDTDNRYGTPRSYANHPWNLDNEITGARDYITDFLPPGKKIEVLQWPGDTSPFPEAVRKTANAGLLNINGGDTRFDNEYDSVAWVAPVGRYIDGGLWQIYAAASNENTYTDHWTDRFYGLRFLSQTYANTELPRRLNPINLYFHAFVVDRAAGLAGLKEALDWISKQPIIPVRTSEYVRVANGFYATKLTEIGPQSWKVSDRGALGTIRFDVPDGMDIDYHASTGVIGSNVANGSLYVALDPDVAEPVVTLAAHAVPVTAELIASRWLIHGVTLNAAGMTYHASGYGPGNMVWKMRDPGRYRISADGQTAHSTQTVATGPDGVLVMSLPHSFDPDIAISVAKLP